jgi:hypothetical protein
MFISRAAQRGGGGAKGGFAPGPQLKRGPKFAKGGPERFN